MKTTILILSNLISLVVFSQENPWTPKGENPWKTNPKNETVEVVKVDTVLKSEMNVTTITTVDSTITTSPLITRVEENKVYDPQLGSQPKSIQKAELEANQAYSVAHDIKIGFTFGMFFNLAGFLPDLIYISHASAQEETIVRNIESDSAYKYVEPKVLKNEVTKKIKTKKSKATLGGTVLGALVQFGIIGAIISIN